MDFDGKGDSMDELKSLRITTFDDDDNDDELGWTRIIYLQEWLVFAIHAENLYSSYSGVKVFRCQLPRTNPYYSTKPPEGNAVDKPLTPGAPLCNWCGTWKEEKICSSCKVARYCSQKHQAMHGRLGHKLECQELSLSPQLSDSSACHGGIAQIKAQKGNSSKSLWPEYEMTNEHESEYDTEMSGDEGHTNNSLITRNKVDDSIITYG
ncbi:hypothetical protein V6N13_087534 [Hibiscus sabdariffa]